MSTVAGSAVKAGVALVALPAAVLALAFAASPAQGADALTAVRARLGDHPANVRVVVDFTGGTLVAGEVEAIDHDPANGSARLRIRKRGILDRALQAKRFGVVVALTQGDDRVDVHIAAARGRFKYLRKTVLHAPERLVIDLYRSRPPARAAEIPRAPGGCLALTAVTPGSRAVAVRGVAGLLFERSFVLRVRDARGRVVGERPLTAEGAWSARLRYAVARAQRGTVEAVAESAMDGSLFCLAQLAAPLRP